MCGRTNSRRSKYFKSLLLSYFQKLVLLLLMLVFWLRCLPFHYRNFLRCGHPAFDHWFSAYWTQSVRWMGFAVEVWVLICWPPWNLLECSVWIGKVCAGSVCERISQETQRILCNSGPYGQKLKVSSHSDALYQNCKFELTRSSRCWAPTIFSCYRLRFWCGGPQERRIEWRLSQLLQ